MGEHALYVWSVYSVFVITFIALAIAPLYMNRVERRRLRREFSVEEDT